MSATAPTKWIFPILVVFICLLGSVKAHAEDEDSYPTLDSHTTVSHSVATFTGAAGASIPIALPPGRNGMQPSVSLAYSSFMRNGWVGVGWNLELGAIRRNTKHGLDYAARDFLAGGSELMAWPQWGSNAFRPKIEGEFNKYFYDSSADTWQIQAKDGRTMFYGRTSDSRQSSNKGTFKWCLDRVEDPNGNYMTISYTKDQGQIYPEEIEYTGHASAAPYYYVRFYLQDRSDRELSHATRSPVTTAKRLKSIAVGSQEGLIRAYQLNYDAGQNSGRSILRNVRIFGNDATVDGTGTVSGTDSILAADLGYEDAAPGDLFQKPFTYWSKSGNYTRHQTVQLDANGDGAQDFALIHSHSNQTNIALFRAVPGAGFEHAGDWTLNAASTSSGDTIHAGDINGDGKDDLVMVPSALIPAGGITFFYCILADQNGALNNLHTVNVSISPQPDSPPLSSYMTDVNGDGLPDIVLMPLKDEKKGFFANACDDSMGQPPCTEINFAATWTCLSNGDGTFSQPFYFDGVVKLLKPNEWGLRLFSDFNGDGRADLFLARKYTFDDPLNPEPNPDLQPIVITLGNGDGTFQDPKPVSLTHTANMLPPNLDNTNYSLGDFNGDGLIDLVYYADGTPLKLTLALSNGDGTFTNKFLSYSDHIKGQIRTGDVNGDGKSDVMIYRQGGGDEEYARVGLLFSNGDGTFGPLMQWYDASGDYDYVFSMMGDYNGDGRTDLVFHENHDGGGPRNLRLALSVAGVEGRLHSIENTLGGITEFEYGPVGACGDARLPYGMSVVTKATVKDPILQVTSETHYAYRGGLHDRQQREFCGFEEVVTTAPNGSQSQSFYHQDTFRKGRLRELNTFGPGDVYNDSPGARVGRAATTWENYFLDTVHKCAFVRIENNQTTVIENNQPITTVSETFTYDSTYNLAQIETTTSDPDVNPTRKSYGNYNYGPWLWRRTEEKLEERVNGAWQVVRKVNFSHDSDGNLTRKLTFNDQGDDVVETFDADPYGNVEYQTNGRGYSASIIFDSFVHTYPVEITNCAGHTLVKQWNLAFGRPDWEQNPNETQTLYEYDAFGRPKAVEVQNKYDVRVARSETYYFIQNRPAYIKKRVLETTEGGAAYIDAWQYLDGLGRTIQTVHRGENGQPVVSRVFYDESGRQVDSYGPFFSAWSGSNPEGVLFGIPAQTPRAWTESFDDRSRPLVVKSRDTGRDLPITYQYSGTSTTVIDPDGAAKTTIQDAVGRVKQVIEDPNGRNIVTQYTYNAAGELLNVRNPLNNLTTMTYDTLGRKRTMNDPDMGVWSYRYDANGNLNWQQDANGRQIEFTFDCLDRPLRKHYINPIAGVDRDVTYTYDDPAITLENPVGRLSRVTNGAVTTVYESYDALGQATMVTKTISGDRPRSTAYAHDLAGKPTHIVYPDGNEVSYEYHRGSGLLQKVWARGVNGMTMELAAYTNYPATGKIGTILFGNNVQTQYTYDPLSTRLTELLTMDGANANIVDRSYTYTPAGDIATLTDASTPSNVITRVYGYDRMHRLISETTQSGLDDYSYLTPSVLDYSYTPGTKPLHAVAAIANLGSSQEFTYDANGNLLTGPDMTAPDAPATRTIAYNSDNMPAQIAHSAKGTTTFTYDGGGGRAKKSGPSGSTYYVGGHFEVSGSGAVTLYIFAGSQRIAMVQGGQIYYFHQDHLGSATALTNYAGQLTQRTDYLPYGGQRGSAAISATRYGFTNQEKDPETGLYNYNARLYDPATAVFVTADSIVPNPMSVMGFQRYGYCNGNPLIYTDPRGHEGLTAIYVTIAISAAIGAGNAAAHGGDWGDIFGGAVTGAVMGAFSAAAFSGAGAYISAEGISNPVGQAAIHMGVGAALGAMGAAMTGQEIGQGALIGGLSAGFSKLVGHYAGIEDIPSRPTRYAARMAVGGMAGAMAATISGNDPFAAFGIGALVAAVAYRFNGEDGLELRKRMADRNINGDDTYMRIGRIISESNNSSYDPEISEKAWADLKVSISEFIRPDIDGLIASGTNGYIRSMLDDFAVLYMNSPLDWVGITFDNGVGQNTYGPTLNCADSFFYNTALALSKK